MDAQRKIAEACKRHGVITGIHNSTAGHAAKMIAEGYRFVTLASDSRFLAAKAVEEISAVRKQAATPGVTPAY